VKNQSKRASSLPEIWGSKELSFVAIKKEYGLVVQKTSLLIEIAEMSELVGAELNEIQLQYLLSYILKNYWYFRISDLTIVVDKMLKEKVYHKPSIQSFITAIDAYDLERSEYAAMHNEELKAQTEKDSAEYIAKFKENYIDMVIDSMKEPVDQKKIDAENRARNNEKIKELRKQFPETLTTPEEIEKENELFVKKLGLK